MSNISILKNEFVILVGNWGGLSILFIVLLAIPILRSRHIRAIAILSWCCKESCVILSSIANDVPTQQLRLLSHMTPLFQHRAAEAALSWLCCQVSAFSKCVVPGLQRMCWASKSKFCFKSQGHVVPVNWGCVLIASFLCQPGLLLRSPSFPLSHSGTGFLRVRLSNLMEPRLQGLDSPMRSEFCRYFSGNGYPIYPLRSPLEQVIFFFRCPIWTGPVGRK